MTAADYKPIPPPDATSIEKVPLALTSMGFAIESFDQAWRFAQSLCAGGVVPKAYKEHPGAVIMLMQAAAQLQIPIHVALSQLTFVNGRLGLMGDLALALIRRSGKLRKGTDLKVVYTGQEKTPEWTCTVTLHREGQPEPVSRSFSIADATKAGLANKAGPWKEYPQRMLYYRALGFLVRDAWSDVLMGLYTREELDDFPEEREINPRPAHEGRGPGADPLLELGEGQLALDFSAEAAAQRAREPVPVEREATATEKQAGLFVEQPKGCAHAHPDGSSAWELRHGDGGRVEEVCTICGEVAGLES